MFLLNNGTPLECWPMPSATLCAQLALMLTLAGGRGRTLTLRSRVLLAGGLKGIPLLPKRSTAVPHLLFPGTPAVLISDEGQEEDVSGRSTPSSPRELGLSRSLSRQSVRWDERGPSIPSERPW